MTASGRISARAVAETADIKARLRANADRLARDLLPDGWRSGNYWLARNPGRADTHAGSFWVWIAGERAGAYCDAASAEKGDVFGLIQLVHGCDFGEAVKWARGWLGDGDPVAAPRRPAPILNRAEEAAEAEREAARKAAAAQSRYRAAKRRPFLGSPADTYLRSRAIDVRALGRLPGVLGWLPDVRHAETDTRWPALIAAFQRPGAPEVVAVHTTFLQPDGSGKAALGLQPDGRPWKPRKIWPSYAGAVMRLWRGDSGLREDEAAACGLCETLVLCEGVEDGLSLALAAPRHRVWAAGALGNLKKVRLPACCDRVIVAADNDWGKPQAAADLQAAVAALVAQGRPVAIARSPVGKDANDALRGTA